MNTLRDNPNDSNGDVLRRLFAAGDDFTRPRVIDFCFVCPERQPVLGFTIYAVGKERPKG